MQSVYIALGSNIDPENNIKAAATMLREKFPGIRFSSVYKTQAREVTDQPDFLNAVAVVESDTSAEDILTVLKNIERHLKKDPPFKFGPRTIDLDLLLYGNDTVTTDELTIPHPRMHERRFVLEPLSEVNDSKRWKKYLDATADQGSMKLPITL